MAQQLLWKCWMSPIGTRKERCSVRSVWQGRGPEHVSAGRVQREYLVVLREDVGDPVVDYRGRAYSRC